MNVTDVTSIISTVGFPIFCCVCLGFFVKYQSDQNRAEIAQMRKDHTDEVSKMTDALNNNTLAIQRLTDKIGDD